MNIIEGLFEKMDRARVILGHYEECGPVGAFGAAIIRADIKTAEAAIAHGDTVAMIESYKVLEEISE